MNIEEVKAKLSPPVDRKELISFMAMGKNIPPLLKSMAYITVTGMSQNELDNIGNIACNVVELLQNGLHDELLVYLKAHSIPDPIARIIVENGKNFITVE